MTMTAVPSVCWHHVLTVWYVKWKPKKSFRAKRSKSAPKRKMSNILATSQTRYVLKFIHDNYSIPWFSIRGNFKLHLGWSYWSISKWLALVVSFICEKKRKFSASADTQLSLCSSKKFTVDYHHCWHFICALDWNKRMEGACWNYEQAT